MAVVRVAELQGALGHAVKAHHELLGLSVFLPVMANLRGQRMDVASVVVVLVDKAKLGNQPRFGSPGIDGIEHAGRRRRAVLGIRRQNQHPRCAVGFQLVELQGNRRVAVAHGVAHFHVVAAHSEVAAQHGGLLLRPDLQR